MRVISVSKVMLLIGAVAVLSSNVGHHKPRRQKDDEDAAWFLRLREEGRREWHIVLVRLQSQHHVVLAAEVPEWSVYPVSHMLRLVL
jgi:hypothetical protein